MKKHLTAALLFWFAMNCCFAQVSVGKQSHGKLKELKQKDFDLIKSKKTIFIVDDIDIEDFKLLVNDVWKVNAFEAITREEYNKSWAKYINDANAIFEVTGYIRTTRSPSGMETEYLYVYMQYYYPTDIKPKKDKTVWDRNEIAAIYFGGNTEAMWDIVRNKKFNDLQEQMYNYQPGYLKNYLQNINDHLVNNKNTWMYETEYDKARIKDLKKMTLYVPEYLKMKSIWGWKDEERENPEELFKNYEFKYEFIDDDALNTKITKNKGEDFYYLMYTKINGQKLVTVINGKNGDIIYKDYQTMSYMLKPKDLKELNKAIKK